MATKSNQSKSLPNQPKIIEDHVPIRKWDLGVDTKFTQFLNVPNIEKLYQRINLVDLNKVKQEEYNYIKGSLDTLYALIGVDTPLKRLLDRSLEELSEERITTYINSITSSINSEFILRKVTLQEKYKIEEQEPSLQLVEYLMNRIDEYAEKEQYTS